MRNSVYALLGAALLALSPMAASAQERPIHVNIGGGPTWNMGDLGEHFGMGWGPAIGVTFNVNPKIGFQFEYAYRFFDIKDDAPFFGATRFSANHTTHQLDFNLEATVTGADSPVRGYIIAGPGAYYRSVDITEYVGTGVICDPYYYICGSYPVSAVIGSRNSWDFGFNFGGGVGIRIGDEAEFYIESRYHYVMGPEFTPSSPLPAAAGQGGSTTGNYIPLTFGFRF